MLAKWNVDPDDVALCPPITSILSNAAGGIETVIAAMRFSDDIQIEKLLTVYDDALPEERRLLPLEAFCVKAEVDVPALLGAAILALGIQSANTVKIIAATSHPQVMQASVRNALKPGGYRDRQQIHTAMRFLPQPKGATTIVTLPGGQVQVESLDPENIDTDDLFPNLSDTQKLLTE